MKKTAKIWLIAAAFLVLVGCVLFVGVMSTTGWDFAGLSAVRYETNTHEINEPFRDIALTTDTADIVFGLSADGKCRVECREDKNAKHAVAVENGTLVVRVNNQKSWYDYIGFRPDSPKITIFLPETEYHTLAVHESTGNMEIPKGFTFASVDVSVSTGNVGFFAAAREKVRIKTSTGDIRVENTAVGALDLSVTTGTVTASSVTCTGDVIVNVSTGKATLTGISCRSVLSTGTTGSISLNHVIATDRFSIERSTGDVKFESCDAAELYIKTTTGSVTGTLLTDKVFLTDTKTGSVDVPGTVTGGRCEIRTNTGDIKVKIG